MASRSGLIRQRGAGLLGVAVHHRPVIQSGVDAAAWAVGVLVAIGVRFDFDLDEVDLRGWARFAVVAALVQTVVGLASGLSTRRSGFGGFDEVAHLAVVVVVATSVLYGLNVLSPGDYLVPRSVVVAGGLTAAMLMIGVRCAWRRWLRRQRDVLLARAAS